MREPERYAMFARISRFKVRDGRLDELKAYRDGRIQKLEKQQGLKYMFGLQGQDGEHLVVALYESGAHAESELALKTAGEFWFQITDLVEGRPEIRSYEVTHFQTFSAA